MSLPAAGNSYQFLEWPLAISLWLIVIAGYVIGFFLRRTIKASHPGTWNALGQPSLFHNKMANSLLWTGFVLRRKYRSLGDPKITRLGNIYCSLVVALLAILSLLLIFALISNGVL